MKYNKAISSSRRKSRRDHFQAHSELRRKILSAPLSNDLQKKHSVRAVPVRKNDEVRVVRGSFKSREGKVVSVYRKKYIIQVEGIRREKNNGQTVMLGVHPSKVEIVKLHMDKDRKALLARKNRSADKKEQVAAVAELD